MQVTSSGTPPLMRFVSHLVAELQRLEPFDRAMTLAAQAFTSIFPLVIATFSVLGRSDGDRWGDRLADALALPSGTRSVLADVRPDEAAQVASFGALSLLVVLVSATSFSRALTRMYAKAWSVRAPGWRGGWRWVAAIVAIAACTVGVRAVHRAADGKDVAVVGAVLLTLLVNAGLWTWVPSVLLARQVSWRLLAPGGVIMGAATVALFFASQVYMPWALDHADDNYGQLGVAFTCIGWLFGVAFVLIVATVLGTVLAGTPRPLTGGTAVSGRRLARPGQVARSG